MRVLLWAGAVVWATGSAACTPLVPKTEHRFRDGEAVVRLERIRTGLGNVTIEARTEGIREDEIVAVWVSSKRTSPCTGSLRSGPFRAFRGGWRWGDGLLSAGYARDDVEPLLSDGLATFDVKLEDGRCLSVPVVTADEGTQWVEKPSFWFGVGSAVHGVVDAPRGVPFVHFSADLRLGYQLGPVRPMLRVLFGAGARNAVDGPGREVSGGFGLAPGADMGGRVSKRIGLRAGLEYEVSWFGAESIDTFVHGPRLRAQLAFLPPPKRWPGVAESGYPGWQVALEPTVALWLTDGERLLSYGATLIWEWSM